MIKKTGIIKWISDDGIVWISKNKNANPEFICDKTELDKYIRIGSKVIFDIDNHYFNIKIAANVKKYNNKRSY